MTFMRYKLALHLLVFAIGLAVVGAAQADDLKRGEELYGLCLQCHGAAGEGDQAALAPAIAGMDQWYVVAQLKNFRSGARGLHPEDMGGMRMYPMSRALATDEDIQDVAIYVSSLPVTSPDQVIVGGDATNGAALYVLCQQCHGAAGEGNQVMNSPGLTGTSDWYLVDGLSKFKKGIRGANPANPNAVMMRGMSNTLADDQAIKDVVAHIMTLQQAN
jgi:cytochrome c oxidase subunit 2